MKDKEKMLHLPERISAYVRGVTAGEKFCNGTDSEKREYM